MAILLIILAVFLLYPVVDICRLSFIKDGALSLQNYLDYFSEPKIFRSFYNSMFVSTVTMVITTVLAFLFAYGLTRTTMPGKGFFYTVSTLPLIAPTIIQALALILLFGRNGVITRYLLDTSWNIYGATGIIVGEVLYCFPNALFILYTTLSAVDTRLDEAAQSLGASALKTFFKVTLPSAKYGIASAAALTFNLTITDFGIPVVIGGDYSVLATEIVNKVFGMQRFDLGATISVILLVPSITAFAINYYLTRKSYAMISGQARPFIQPSRPLKKWAFTAYSSFICACILLVFVTVFIGSFVRTWPYDFSLTLKHFDFPSLGASVPFWTSFWNSVLEPGPLRDMIAIKYAPIWTSLMVSLVVAVVGASITLVAAYIIEKKKPRGEQLLYALSVLPAAIPGVVLGLGYVLAFNKPYFLDLWDDLDHHHQCCHCQFHAGTAFRDGKFEADRQIRRRGGRQFGRRTRHHLYESRISPVQGGLFFHGHLLFHARHDHDQRRLVFGFGTDQAGRNRDHLPRCGRPHGERQCHVYRGGAHCRALSW